MLNYKTSIKKDITYSDLEIKETKPMVEPTEEVEETPDTDGDGYNDDIDAFINLFILIVLKQFQRIF